MTADAMAKNKEIGSLPHSRVPTLRIHSIPFHEMHTAASSPEAWQWARLEGSPPLGNLRTMLSHHRVRAYRLNRDVLRAPGRLTQLDGLSVIGGGGCQGYGNGSNHSVPAGIFVGTEKIRRSPPTHRTHR